MISIRNATENNLQSVNLDLPENKLIVITGVSGSGKSSLVFDLLYREAESRYFSSFSSHARQLLGKVRRPAAELISGLPPAIAVRQEMGAPGPRSTVGTMTGLYDYLRLLYARTGLIPPGTEPFPLSRSLFSFNNPLGACPDCKGLGLLDRIDPDLLVADPSKTLRQGALVITAPNGYIIYSQVTMEVLDQVCRAEGFHTDIPWQELTAGQKKVVLYGSNKLEIPFGKHPLESRMKWSGITAKPRELGYYKGIVPIMEAILQRDRNKNILRFVRTGPCHACQGTRLNPTALSVTVEGHNIAALSAMEIGRLEEFIQHLPLTQKTEAIAGPICRDILRRTAMLRRLGLGYLTLDRHGMELSGGESGRLHLASQTLTGLSGLLYIFDEPSVGLHPDHTLALIGVLHELVEQGNTVVVVEHDEEFIRHADWLVDVGPGPGPLGGQVLVNCATEALHRLPAEDIERSQTLRFLTGLDRLARTAPPRHGEGELVLSGASAHNLKGINVQFLQRALNVVTGTGGAGKSTLVHHTLGTLVRQRMKGDHSCRGLCTSIAGWEGIGKVITIDQSPIGRTPRSNPATYTGLFDPVRDLFAALPESKAKGLEKGSFSFNTTGGRCEACEGAGYQQVGMHFMGTVEVLCEQCEGARFNKQVLSVSYRDRNVAEVLEMTVSEAIRHFSDEKKILRFLTTLDALGLGYLTLGQRSSTLSGGEAQRIKLATELANPGSTHTLYLLDEPTTGLHQADIANLLHALDRLVEQGHTVVVIEHHPVLILHADHIVDLGPGSGYEGGRLIVSGPPDAVVQCNESVTGEALRRHLSPKSLPSVVPLHSGKKEAIAFRGVTTHNLKGIDADIPHNRITVITGVSGSGKSTLAFDTLYAEGQNRFLGSFSAYVRARLGVKATADFEEITGMTPTFAVDQELPGNSPRSTVGTLTGIYDFYRLLYARAARYDHGAERPGDQPPPACTSSLFSFNHQRGACPQCDGLGTRIVCDPERLITHPDRSILDGAMDGTRTGKFYGDPYGQYIATLKAVSDRFGDDLTLPWNSLSQATKDRVMLGTGDTPYDVTWSFKRDQRTGEHHFRGTWQGLTVLVNEEYKRKHADHRAEGMLPVMSAIACAACSGTRLTGEALRYKWRDLHIAALANRSVTAALALFTVPESGNGSHEVSAVAAPLVKEIVARLRFIEGMGLGYLALSRNTSTLSGGETRRLKLAAQLGSGLTGLTYVLDEPTLGLHPDDISRLMQMIRGLQQQGNTIVMVEHTRPAILSSDHVIDLGPGAGKQGGTVVATGTPASIIFNPTSVTGPFLAGQNQSPTPRRKPGMGLTIRNAFANNLKGFDIGIPSGVIVAVTGVSGSGKSTLLFDVIDASWQQKRAVGCSSISGWNHFRRLVPVQPRSSFSGGQGTLATFTGLFDRLRERFAETAEAKSLGLGRSHFSFIAREGRCEGCQGAGHIRISMDFLPDVFTDCEVCHGTRYKEEILKVRLRGRTIAGVLEMTCSEALQIFGDDRKLAGTLQILEKIGLGYLTLGQGLNTLSGGEAQRLTLACELMGSAETSTLYLFEEPSAGLHFIDTQKLIILMNELANKGNTILMIEHNPDMIAIADHVITLGPAGGDAGGYLTAEG